MLLLDNLCYTDDGFNLLLIKVLDLVELELTE